MQRVSLPVDFQRNVTQDLNLNIGQPNMIIKWERSLHSKGQTLFCIRYYLCIEKIRPLLTPYLRSQLYFFDIKRKVFWFCSTSVKKKKKLTFLRYLGKYVLRTDLTKYITYVRYKWWKLWTSCPLKSKIN